MDQKIGRHRARATFRPAHEHSGRIRVVQTQRKFMEAVVDEVLATVRTNIKQTFK